MKIVRRGGIAAVIFLILILLISNIGYSAQGDGIFLYGESTPNNNIPKYRTWTNSSNTVGSENSAQTTANTTRHVITRQAPTRNEVIAGIQATTGALYVQRWNGSSWSSEWNVTVGDGNLPRFDIAYERQSGNALVVYSANTGSTNELIYRTYNGSSWSSPQNYDAQRTSGVVQAVRLKSQKASNYIGLIWADANFDLSANFWNGDSSAFTGEPSSALSTNLSKVGSSTTLTTWSFDLEFENVSNKLMVVWGDDTLQQLSYVIRSAGSGGSWGSTSTDTTFYEEPTDIEIKAEPFSNYIGYVNATDNRGDGGCAIWNGSSWGNYYNFDTKIASVAAGTKNISSSWLISGSQSRFVFSYDDFNSTGVEWVTFNKNTSTWAVQSPYTGSPAPYKTSDTLHRMSTNPFDFSQAILIVIDSNSDLFTKKLTFDGTNYTWTSVEPGGASPEPNISSSTGFAADFSYYRFIPSLSLAVDIVDANGSSVSSPSVSFSSLNTSFSCQTSTGTLGTSSAKIRIDNPTANNLWTLTIAATSGAASNWSNGASGQYDFNDPSGSPGGCSDGGDSDSLAGQLTFDGSSSTVTSVLYNDCDTNGVTKGSSAGFNQGTVDSITLLNTSSSAITNCTYDATGFGVSQKVPEQKPTGTYTINMTLTITAN